MKIELLAALSLVVAPMAASAEIECTGTVISAGVQADGSLVVSLLLPGQLQQHPHYICNVVAQTSGTTTYKMDPIACRAALSTLLTARASTPAAATTPVGASVKIKYADLTACNNFSDWSAQVSANMVRIAP